MFEKVYSMEAFYFLIVLFVGDWKSWKLKNLMAVEVHLTFDQRQMLLEDSLIKGPQNLGCCEQTLHPAFRV
jgi:hypothetical protein